MEISKVGVVGCGLMGSGIAEISAKAGLQVVVREMDAKALEAGTARVQKSLERAVSRGKATDEERVQTLDRISFSTRLEDLADADLVIEAVVEDPAVKNELFKSLDEICKPETILASNTSSLTITDMAAATNRPEKLVGLHFFNPVPVMKLVEVVKTIVTSEETVEAAMAYSRTVGKVPILAKDNSGFVVNLLLVPYMLDAIRQLERGVASIKDIDTGMQLGCGYPMGPFTLCDFVGIDTLYRISEIMFDEYREERYAPPPLLKRIVAMGRYGRKTKMGFYDWTGPEPVPLPI